MMNEIKHIVFVPYSAEQQINAMIFAKKLALTASTLGYESRVLNPSEQLAQPLPDLLVMVGEAAPNLVNHTPLAMLQFGLDQVQQDPAVLLQEAIASQKTTGLSLPPSEIAPALRFVAITACPTGVAHTFMAAEALQQGAQALGYQIAVETQGSVGAKNVLSEQAIAQADIVILATDIEVNTDRFVGKRIYRCSTGFALKQTSKAFAAALSDAKIHSSDSPSPTDASSQKSEKTGLYKHLLTGVSFMLPMVVAGGLLIALSFCFGITAFEVQGSVAAALKQIGDAAFLLMVPMLSGYIAYSIADRPGLAPGLIGGVLASQLQAGFLGGILSGFLAGYLALFLAKRLKLPHSLEALKPILIIPLLGALLVGLAMIYVIGGPVAQIFQAMEHFLNTMGTTNAIVLGMILAGMMCVDLGGPINKAAYAFTVGLLTTHTYLPMAITMAGGMVPAIGLAIATWLAKAKFAQAERDAGKASFVLGLCFISEGAIPFAAKDPMRVIPCCILGGAVTGALVAFFHCELMAPHGGIFVLLIPGAISHAGWYLLAIAAGSLLTGIAYASVKPKMVAEGLASVSD
jgi:PTS system fructose-specific IIC component